VGVLGTAGSGDGEAVGVTSSVLCKCTTLVMADADVSRVWYPPLFDVGSMLASRSSLFSESLLSREIRLTVLELRRARAFLAARERRWMPRKNLLILATPGMAMNCSLAS
jgi:hypothetical protein